MAAPPAYETIATDSFRETKREKAESENEQRWNIREVVAASRTQHIASIVEQLLPKIKTRAKQGHARTDMILIPSDQGDFSSVVVRVSH